MQSASFESVPANPPASPAYRPSLTTGVQPSSTPVLTRYATTGTALITRDAGAGAGSTIVTVDTGLTQPSILFAYVTKTSGSGSQLPNQIPWNLFKDTDGTLEYGITANYFDIKTVQFTLQVPASSSFIATALNFSVKYYLVIDPVS